MASPLASPRSSTSSADIYSGPPLTPLSDLGLDKATERLVLSDNDAEEDGLDTIPEASVLRGTWAGQGGRKEADSAPVNQAYRTRPDPKTEALDQFAGFSFGRPLSPPTDMDFPPHSSWSSEDRFPPRSTSQAMSIPGSRSPPRSPNVNQDQDPLPSSSFSFGSCPSLPLRSTPTAELGAFEYPEYEVGHPLHGSNLESAHMRASTSSSSATSSTSSSYSRGSTSSMGRGSIPLGLALGQTHRRNSIIARPMLHPSLSSSSSTHTSATATGYPSPPQTRRSSTTSTIATIPAGGRRPSIIHSATTELGSGLPLPSISSIYPDHTDNTSYPPPSPYNHSNRRASILFPPKHLHQPVPPSLLARRGSMPVSSLGPLAAQPFSPQRAANSRSSISIPLAGYGGPGQITSHRLYNRRESVLSVGSSQGSGSTVRMGRDGETGEVTRRSSLRERTRRSGSVLATEAGEEKGDGPEGESSSQGASGGLARRSSMPIHHALSATTRIEASERSSARDQSVTLPHPSNPYHSPASPRSTSSSHVGPPLNYGSPVRRHRSSIANPIHSSLGAEEADDSGPRRGWTPRPSLTGRSLSSSEESDESGEGAEDGVQPVGGSASEREKGGPMLFSDPWAGKAATGEGSLTSESMQRGDDRGSRSSLVDLGRPALETVDSDRTERASE